MMVHKGDADAHAFGLTSHYPTLFVPLCKSSDTTNVSTKLRFVYMQTQKATMFLADTTVNINLLPKLFRILRFNLPNSFRIST
jgi:phosphotransacetylase